MPNPNISVDAKGVIHVHNNALNREPGTRLHHGGEFMSIAADQEHISVEVIVQEDPFEYPKLYNLVMSYRSNQTQEQEAVVTVRPFNSDHTDANIICKTGFTIPKTEDDAKQWRDLEPVSLDTPLGGFSPKKTTVRITFVGIKGFLQVQHFRFIPLNADDAETIGTPLWFQNWYTEIREKVLGNNGILPQLVEGDALAALKAGAAKIDEAKKVQDKTPGHRPMHDADKNTAAVAEQVLKETALPILEGMDEAFKNLDLDNNIELLQFIVMTLAKPLRLADYCSQGEIQKERLMTLLKDDTELLKDMLAYGGPKKHLYGQAMDIYLEIQGKMATGKQVLPKLALAAALELCYPIQELNDTINIDPVERYLHYERMYLEGELDPAFESLSVWELRMALTSTATSDELEWCKDMMKTFRPDHVYTRDYTKMGGDVHYNKPTSDVDMLKYQHIISYGGYCGARAKFGRISVQAFGVPTWGLVIPGHATFNFWTEGGFTRLYGGGKWEGRRAYDFYNELVARKVLGDEEYFRKVDILAVMSVVAGEDPKDCHPHPDAPWYTLANLQRRRYGSGPEPKSVIKKDLEVESSINAMAAREVPDKVEVSVNDDGTIVVPSFARTSEENAVFMKSYEGGMQVYTPKVEWSLEFTIPGDMAPKRKAYKLTAKVCTAHDVELAPLNFDIDGTVAKVSVPYTTGAWEETKAVEVELGGGDDTTIKLNRTAPFFPMALKEFKFTPV